uniref:Ribonuclease H-like domain-containing protein n=1 Tax=Tanacetum cinerariifolium TaxID=118510 RepID=A0A6L2MUE5_TANCI|nr:ribonuclease H-like domain-containing protein [Tanacetum cinerariifolium]
MTHTNHQRHVVPTLVLTRSRLVALTTARPVTTDVPQPYVTRSRPTKTIVTKPYSPPRRNINRKPSFKSSNFPQKVTTAMVAQVDAVKGIQENWGNPQHDLKDKGVIDSGCSRHMTGNMSYLSDFEQKNGGYVAFGGNPKGGKITGKGKFDRKDDEGFLVGYSVSRSGPTWLFDLDTLTKSMNYQPVTAGNQPNPSVDPQNTDGDATFEVKEPEFKVEKLKSEVDVSPSSSAKTKKHDDKTKREAKGKKKIKKKNNVKARSMLLMTLPTEHLMNFNQYKDAKSLFSTIETRFCGNEATKKTQKTLLKQISLPSEWNTHVVVWRNKPDLDTMSIDDLYNNFKIIEQEVKRTASSNSSSQNMDFVSYPSTNSTNDVYIAYGVSTASTQSSTASTKVNTASSQMSTANLSDATVYAFLANQSNGSQLVHKDLKQIHEDDLEEMDLKWQLALLSMRKKRNRYQDSSRRTVHVEETHPKDMVAIDGVGFDWSYMDEDEVPTNMALMAFSHFEGVKTDKSKNGLGFQSYNVVPPPATLVYNIGRPKSCEKESNNASEDIPNEPKEYPDAPLVKDRVLDNKYCLVESPIVVKKKIDVPTIAKVEFVRPKQQEKLVRKPVRPRAVNTARPRAVNTARPRAFSTAKPNSAVVNAVRANQVNVVKASACWISMEDMLPLVEKQMDWVMFSWFWTNICRLISWQCKKQTVVATSSTKAEYVAAASCCAQVIWIQNQLLDYRKKVIIIEATVREALHLADAKSIDCLPNEEIFTELSRMGYEKPSSKITFYKAFFFAQCRKFTFSKYIFDSLVRNVDSSLKFYMRIEHLKQDKKAQTLEITKLKQRVRKLERKNKVKVSGLRRLKKGEIIANIDADEDVTLKDVVDDKVKENADNMAGFKLDYFKGMSYDDIRLIFEKYFNSNVAFLKKTKEQLEEKKSRALKRTSKSLKEKAAKKQKLDEEVEELKKHLQIMPNDDDDVYTEATLLALKLQRYTLREYYCRLKTYCCSCKLKLLDDATDIKLRLLKQSAAAVQIVSAVQIVKTVSIRVNVVMYKLRLLQRYTLRDYYCWLKTYCCSCKLKLLDDAADIKLRLLEQSAAAGIRLRNMTKYLLLLEYLLNAASDSYYCQYK